jgi:chromodomain-helicase-DNA-binding protein 1
MIINVCDEIYDLCNQASEDNEKDKRNRIAAGEQLTTAQKSKAVLVTYRNVSSINAETVVSRCRDLKNLYSHLHALNTDELYNWRIPINNIRPTLNWSGKWGPEEDAMLLVGAFLYGFGNWEAIQKDVRLELDGKFFLEEGKKGEDSANRPIPNAIHLVRRGDFLLGLLFDHDEKLRTWETSMRTKGQLKESPTPPPLPPPSNGFKRRAESEAVASVEGAPRKKKRRPTPTFTDSSSSDDWSVSTIFFHHVDSAN